MMNNIVMYSIATVCIVIAVILVNEGGKEIGRLEVASGKWQCVELQQEWKCAEVKK